MKGTGGGGDSVRAPPLTTVIVNIGTNRLPMTKSRTQRCPFELTVMAKFSELGRVGSQTRLRSTCHVAGANEGLSCPLQ